MPLTPHQLGAAGVGLTGLAGEAAWLHMEALCVPFGVICGAATAVHCAVCPLSVTVLGASLASLAASVFSRRAAVEI